MAVLHGNTITPRAGVNRLLVREFCHVQVDVSLGLFLDDPHHPPVDFLPVDFDDLGDLLDNLGPGIQSGTLSLDIAAEYPLGFFIVAFCHIYHQFRR